mmetsp:Transcript_10269/g.28306  ORF Transcript_10269/g.28306 Transcript_10269/m.28306 type:complete len:290 (+) Transcript_10269:83-952(+)
MFSHQAAKPINDCDSSHLDESSNFLGQTRGSYYWRSSGEPAESKAPVQIHTPKHEDHLGESRQYWRDIILGVNDGLISTFLLVTGVAGGGLSSTDILLTAIAGAIAGAVSMLAGEYVATKSQNEVLHGEITLEQRHIQYFRESELEELRGHLLNIIGICSTEQQQLSDQLVDYYKHNPEAMLKVMTALEFGVVDDEVRSPVKAGAFSGLLFAVGAVPSIIPFVFLPPFRGLIVAAVATTCSLLLVGGIKTWATRGDWRTAALENLVIAGAGGLLAYGVGIGFDAILREN